VSMSANRKAAPRVSFYTSRRLSPRLCLLFVALTLATLPLNEVSISRAPTLIPLRTIFIPFDSSLETPSPPILQLSVLTILSKRIALAHSWASGLVAPDHVAPSDLEIDGRVPSGFVTFRSGRSPPLLS